MNQRGVAIVAEYLSKRPQGRVVRVKPIAEDDYLIAIEDVRDGRVQLIRSAGDLEVWLTSFRQGRCVQPVGALCGICDHIHGDRDHTGELMRNCIRCQAELVEVAAESLLREEER